MFGKSRRNAAIAIMTGAGTVVALAASPAEATPAHAAPLKVVKTLSSAYVGPLQFAVDGRRIFVADSFTSTLNLVGRAAPLVAGPGQGGDIAGVAVDPHARALAYTTSSADHSTTTLTIVQKGKKPVVADLSGFERTRNPDHRTTYGVEHPSKCVSDALTAQQIPVTYKGEVDSHPYSVIALGRGNWAVADAGGNDIVKVDRYGHVSLISVLPRLAVKVTPAFAAASGLPACVVGITYNFEPVPTDVELGPRGELYATSLPGGPEGPEGGNPGSVFQINPWNGKAYKIATGFNGATNLAVDSRGHLFVAEISSGTISQVVRGHRVPVLSLPGVVGLEFANGHLYASTAPAAVAPEGTPPSGPGSIYLLGPAHSQY